MGHGRGSKWLASVRWAGIFFLACLGTGRAPCANEQLPRYDLAIDLDVAGRTAHIRQRVTWTNTTRQPRSELVFNFYPHYAIPAGDRLLFAKTLELLRMQPSEGIDRQGPHGVVTGVTLSAGDGAGVDPTATLSHSFAADQPTALTVKLPTAVPPGGKVAVDIAFRIHLPNKQGRWGQWNGVTFMTNSFPVLAYCDDSGWRAMPFVPWHQPWFNEAGIYRATVTLPVAEKLACPGVVESETDLGDGRKRVQTAPFVGRDFAVLCSARYQEFKGETSLPDGRRVKLKCLAFPEHEYYATEILKIVGEAIAVYSAWFGPFPYPEFTVAESYFGWNGNECAGLIMIDERVFGMPKLARGYVEYLVSHETCHQWWYNIVGTNGYAEPFMDEGAATYFTHRLLDHKNGPNNEFMAWPKGAAWLPNIRRENYRYASMYSAIRKGEMTPAAQDLPRYGHLFALFTGAYDRGSKVFGMIEAQLGEAAFLDFTRLIVAKYSFRVIQAADYRRELEAYTGRDWGEFFDRWVYGKGMTDWSVEAVAAEDKRGPVQARVFGSSSGPAHSTTVTLRQKGELTEPTLVRFQLAGGSVLDVPVGHPEPIDLPEQGAKVVPAGANAWRVEVATPSAVEQVTVDPHRVLLDRDPGNNVWKPGYRWHVSPLYNMLDETDLTNDYDKWNFGAGPWIGGALYRDPWYTRSTMLGVRAGAYRTQIFSGGVYAAFRTDYRDAVVGADALWDHWPLPKTQVGFNFEHRVLAPIGTDAPSGQNRAALFARYVLQYGSSLYLPPMHYVEAFTTYTDNFLPFTRNPTPGGQRFEWTQTTGLHWRLNLYTPYWDPEGGFYADASYGGGAAKLGGSTVATHQLRGELAGVRSLASPCGSESGGPRIAARVVGEGATPDRGEFFALGGGTLFRGYDLAERQGSALWVTNLELRVPLVREARWDVLDHVVGGRNLWLVGFYDAGAVYTDGHTVGNVAHAVGAGLRLDTAIFSFIERATFRFDVGKTVNDNTPVQFWLGFQHAF